jgi:hypothetical protein
MITIKTQQVIELGDWDNLVISTYGKPYSFQQQYGCQDRGNFPITIPSEYDDDFENDTIPDEINGDEEGVSFAAWLARDPEEWNGDPKDKFLCKSLFWSRNWYPDIQTVANDLHDKGLIPVGDYVIEIDW